MMINNLLLVVVVLSITACGGREYKSDLKKMEEDKKSCEALEGKYVITTYKLYNGTPSSRGDCIFDKEIANVKS